MFASVFSSMSCLTPLNRPALSADEPADLSRQRSAALVCSQQDVFIRYGVAEDQGCRSDMQDATHATMNIGMLCPHISDAPLVNGFFGVFDGHGGRSAASFVCDNLLQSLLVQKSFPTDISSALRDAFFATDSAYIRHCAEDPAADMKAGTTALSVVLWGSRLYIANAGDSRAVMSRNGRAVVLTRDHKPEDDEERRRILNHGGTVCEDGRLCGELAVSRALGNFHLSDHKAHCPGHLKPLTADPEVLEVAIGSDDEFLLLACDGLWDVMSNDRAVELARMQLRQHDDPVKCSEELIKEAKKMHTSDNVSVVTISFRQLPAPRKFLKTSMSVDGLAVLQRALLQ